MKSPAFVFIGTALLVLMPGCVVGHRSLNLEVPKADSYSPSADKGTIGVGMVSDDRVFQNKPSEPSIPSIDGDVNSLTPETKSTYIGRQRNSYGHAMGDIVLPQGETVQTKVDALLREGLKRRGYTLIAGPAPADNQVTAKVNQFWSWMTPGFVALTFEVEIKCSVTVQHAGKAATFDVRGYGLNHGQIAKSGNWEETFDEAFADFVKDLDRGLSGAGF